MLTASYVKCATEFFQSENIDLVLLDIELPDGNGFDLYRKMKGEISVPEIFLTASEEESDVVKGLDMGAEDYLITPFRTRELVSRIKRALRRSGKGREILRCGDIALDAEKGIVTRGEIPVTLTKLEYKILSVMISHPGRLFTRDEILADIWDVSGNFVNDNTLSVAMKRIREKLNDSEGKLIKTVRGMGYRMEVPH